jgi:nucleotidyltransferase/DNA polymerase involved in DNA repair
VYGELDAGSEADARLAIGAAVCARARAAVRQRTGFTCSGGVSHNKLLSKLASARNKPDKQARTGPACGGRSALFLARVRRALRPGGRRQRSNLNPKPRGQTIVPASGFASLTADMRLHALRGLGGKFGRQERPCLLPAAIRLTHFLNGRRES